MKAWVVLRKSAKQIIRNMDSKRWVEECVSPTNTALCVVVSSAAVETTKIVLYLLVGKGNVSFVSDVEDVFY